MVQDVRRYVHDSVDRSTTALEGTECFSSIGSTNSPDFHLHRVPHGPEPPRRRFRNRFPPQPSLVRIAIRNRPRGVLRQQHRWLSPYLQNRFAGHFSLSRFARIGRRMGYPGRCCKPCRFTAFPSSSIYRRRSGLPLWAAIKLLRNKVAAMSAPSCLSLSRCPMHPVQRRRALLPVSRSRCSPSLARSMSTARGLCFFWRAAG